MFGRGRPGGGFVRQYENSLLSLQLDTSAPTHRSVPQTFLTAVLNLDIPSHEPKDVQVTLSLRTTTSATTIPLHKDPPPTPFYIQVHASIKCSTHPTLPVTLATWRTPLEREHQCTSASTGHEREEGGEEEAEEEGPSNSPAWFNSALTALRNTTDPSKFVAPKALGLIGHRRGGFTRDLRASWDFITIPPAGRGKQGEEKAEVVVRHLLPQDDLRFHRTDGAREMVSPEPGEKYIVAPSAGGLGTFWWRWGDLQGDLAGKMFQADEWWDGNEDEEENEKGGGAADWVKSEGGEGFGLTMEVENYAEAEFV